MYVQYRYGWIVQCSTSYTCISSASALLLTLYGFLFKLADEIFLLLKPTTIYRHVKASFPPFIAILSSTLNPQFANITSPRLYMYVWQILWASNQILWHVAYNIYIYKTYMQTLLTIYVPKHPL